MDAITLLKNDHKSVEQLFKQYERAGDDAYTQKRKIVDRIIEELSVHAAVEEQLFYPVTRLTVASTEDVALESIEEHHIVKWELSELEGLDPRDERFDPKVKVLIENVRHHVKEEEGEYFRHVRDELGRADLDDLGESMAEAKKRAPTHPHPKAPDSPPGNVVTGAVIGTVDRVADTARGIAQGGVGAAQDLVDRVLRRRSSASSPTGSTRTRQQAQKVRRASRDATARALEELDNATDKAGDVASTVKRTATSAGAGAKRTGQAAKRGTKRTARAAKSGAKGTATSAKRTAKATAGSAKRGTKRTAGAAKSGAKGTTTSAKRTAKATAGSAKRGTKRTARAATSGAKGTATSAKRTTKATAGSARKSAGSTTTTAKRNARTTKSTAKRAATTTGRTASSAAKRTSSTAKTASKRTAAAARR